MNIFRRVSNYFKQRKIDREQTKHAFEWAERQKERRVLADGAEHLDLRLDMDTFTSADWMKVLEAQETRITKLRQQNIDLREQNATLLREQGMYKRALELVGINAAAAHAFVYRGGR